LSPLNNNPLQVSGISYTWHAGVMPSVGVADVAIGGVPIVATDTLGCAETGVGISSMPYMDTTIVWVTADFACP